VVCVVTPLLFITTIASSLLARSGLPTGTAVLVVCGGSHDYLSLLLLIALAARSQLAVPAALLQSGHVSALFSPILTLHVEDGGSLDL